MPKRLYNDDGYQTAVINNESPGVLPGQSRVFSDEEIAQGFTGKWDEKDPRRGLSEERAWKQKRDAQPADGDAVPDPPAEAD